MATTGFVVYLLSAFSAVILSALFLIHYQPSSNSISFQSSHARYGSEPAPVWPELKASWRLVLATVIGFFGSACGTVGGVGGGGIFVPMLTLLLGFDAKSAAALSKCALVACEKEDSNDISISSHCFLGLTFLLLLACFLLHGMIMGASASSVWYNLRVPHPTKEVPILDYDLALLFQPMLMLGITVGVALSVVFPYWLITLLIIVLFVGTSSRSFFKGIEMWKEETILKKEFAKQQATMVNSRGELLIDTPYEPLIPKEEKTAMQILRFNLRWKRILVLVMVWVAFLLLQVIKNDVKVCSAWYWVLFCLQFPIALALYGYEAVKLYKEHKKRMTTGNPESICEASIEWTPLHLAFCALCGIIGGTVGGLLGSGGGFVLGPLLLEIGVIPQVASATATFVMMFSSSLSVVEFYLLKRFPIPHAIYLTTVSILAGFWGQFLLRKLITILRRASIIVFILSGVIFASAITMGVVGIEKSIRMIHSHEFMGFLGFCRSQ